MKLEKNQRGFYNGTFTDENGNICSIQKSSLAFEDCIWLGIDKVKAQIMAVDSKKLGFKCDSDRGWIAYDIPKEVHIFTRMHLTRDQVKELLPTLQKFVDTGDIK